MEQEVHDLKTQTSVNPMDFDLFVGMDVDKPGISFSVSNWEAGVIVSSRIPYDAKHLVGLMSKRYTGAKIAFAYEAGPTGFGLFDELTDAGYSCLVVTPSMVPRKALERTKTNKVDAKKLSMSLRGGELEGIRVPQGPYRRLRDLTHVRQVCTKTATASMCRIKMLLLKEGMTFPGSCWSKKVLVDLETLPEFEPIRFELSIYIEQLRLMNSQKKTLRAKLEAFCSEHPAVKEEIDLLATIPGLGFVTAAEVLARIGDPRHLKRCQEVSCFFGLTPWESSTGLKQDKDNISGMGDSYVRNLLIESSWRAIRDDEELREFFHRIRRRHPKDRGRQKAIVAVASKLARRIYAVLKQRRPFETRPPTKPVASPEREKARSMKKQLSELTRQDAATESKHQVTVRGERK